VRRKRTRDKIGAPCKSSYGRTREGSQVDVSAQKRGGEETGEEEEEKEDGERDSGTMDEGRNDRERRRSSKIRENETGTL